MGAKILRCQAPATLRPGSRLCEPPAENAHKKAKPIAPCTARVGDQHVAEAMAASDSTVGRSYLTGASSPPTRPHARIG